MRVTSPHVPDFESVFPDLAWGKWSCHLHLANPPDCQRLRQLILDADVVVDGYRPGVMDRLGFGRAAVLDLVRHRGRGIVHVRENCYGWHGGWSHRSGWQGISDACCGVSLAYGRAMGLDEPVTPPFPNSDSCTGTIGAAAIVHALLQRAQDGGSYGVDLALNYYSQWLVRSCGTYPPDVWHDVWTRHASPVFHVHDNTRRTVPAMKQLLQLHDSDVLLQPGFFHECFSSPVGVKVRKVKPVARYGDGVVDLAYNVGARGNGVDDGRWPDDLTVPVVAQL
ncbi:hypothetical protein CDD82_632 [Ophiocordyceps australis]|uniref:CoA-transferase family III domain-containing protein n=1 Tax=Ophiocordyceps australis TaxID=1399860 RepID=A0A2C5YM07_9HYPO|nr:hypothetical protein CDD82_632 [Ophiocordyceps australis]